VSILVDDQNIVNEINAVGQDDPMTVVKMRLIISTVRSIATFQGEDVTDILTQALGIMQAGYTLQRLLGISESDMKEMLDVSDTLAGH